MSKIFLLENFIRKSISKRAEELKSIVIKSFSVKTLHYNISLVLLCKRLNWRLNIHCRQLSAACCRCSSVEQSSIAHHCCPPSLSPSSAVVLNHISSHFLIPLSDSSLTCTAEMCGSYNFRSASVRGRRSQIRVRVRSWLLSVIRCQSASPRPYSLMSL